MRYLTIQRISLKLESAALHHRLGVFLYRQCCLRPPTSARWLFLFDLVESIPLSVFVAHRLSALITVTHEETFHHSLSTCSGSSWTRTFACLNVPRATNEIFYNSRNDSVFDVYYHRSCWFTQLACRCGGRLKSLEAPSQEPLRRLR